MTLDALRSHALARLAATEDQPFGPDVLAFRVGGKIFALLSLDALPPRVNLKCDPERAVELRERHPAVQPGYHMNKRHWNTVVLDGTLDDALVRELVEHAHALVVASLPARVRAGLRA